MPYVIYSIEFETPDEKNRREQEAQEAYLRRQRDEKNKQEDEMRRLAGLEPKYRQK